MFPGKSWTLKEAGLIVKVFGGFKARAGCVVAAGASARGKKRVWEKG
jgi:hypothetical protein